MGCNVFKLVLIQNILPIFFAERESGTDGVRLVDVLGADIEGTTVGCHDDVLLLAEDKILLSVDLKADVNLTPVEVMDLAKVVKLIVEDHLSFLLSWLKLAEDLGHELSILLVVPAVVIVFVLRIHLFEPKGVPIVVNES